MTVHTKRPSVLCGLIGAGLQKSRTPPMHEQEGQEQGLRYVYKTIDIEPLKLGVDALPELITAAERMGFCGLNITHPFKQRVIPLLHELSEDARALNAVNTVVLKDGRRIGHNTDWWGFAEGFKRGLPDVKRDCVVQVGAGGAGAAVAHAAMLLGVKKLYLNDIDPAKAQSVADNISTGFGRERVVVCADVRAAMAEADGMINSTPIGMASYPGLPLPEECLKPSHWVAEVVYFPLETELLKVARAKGCRTVDGGGMAVFQAVRAFQLFTGIEPDADRMKRHFASLGA